MGKIKFKGLIATLDIIIGLLIAIALVNWGLVGWFNFNLVEFLFRFNWLILTVYTIVAVVGTGYLIGFIIRSIGALYK